MSKNLKPLRIEAGVVVGTASDKYESRNIIAQKLIQGFDDAVITLLKQVDPERITEVGCGEGHVTQLILQHTHAPVNAFDFSATILEEARTAIASDRVNFAQCSIYDLKPEQHAADLVVCCEVLEHLTDPEAGLKVLAELAHPYALLSVPREPLWCALNLVRGAYWKSFGNTPGHLQHWSKTGFLKFVSQRFDIVHTVSPLPWTMVLVKSKTASA